VIVAEASGRLTELHARLQSLVRRDPAVDARLLGESQLQVARNLVTNERRAPGAKGSSQVPGSAGFRIYLAYWTQEEHAAAMGMSQRVLGPTDRPVRWDPATMRLRLGPGSRDGAWTLINAAGRIVRVTVECGSDAPRDEIDAVLDEIARTLLP
jgi:hypothetical protein